MAYTFLLIIFMICIDQGDGHWKEKERENLRHDIQAYKELAEKIEREIESFYDKNPEERYKEDDFSTIHYKNVANMINHQKETGKDGIKTTKDDNVFNTHLNNVTSSGSSESKNYEGNLVKVTFKNNQPVKSEIINSPWPKFEDILLAMGRKYDWKNDRWIKVKGKLKGLANIMNSKAVDKNNIEFHEKHKFSYRIVKLNKSKSRRNVVVAVSAVR
ncbi:unnamed protein product [Arctia plantaginis]|uniref:Uncharacterized protein n=1 Tax=Arctia plantaginis TaxID=874455 RepID=A0A8S0YXE3_ARCPL|nr:unnamed protein product [Arctia plantaginis]CAB3230027.1 unnamed protein product [Arctia plantaginis]